MARRLQNRFTELLARKERLEGRSFTRREVARATGISLSSVQAWALNVTTRFDGKAVVALCDFFNCSVNDLLVIEEVADVEEGEKLTPLIA